MNTRRVRGWLFIAAGRAGCLLAALVLLGGHWAVLQSFAWARMFGQYARGTSLSIALVRTFDGRHPCHLCLAIQKGREQEQEEKDTSPWVRPVEGPDLLFADFRPTSAPLPPVKASPQVPFVPRWHPDFVDSPLTPPPKGAAAVS